MKKFDDYNPIAIFLYYMMVLIPVMFSQNPIMLLEGMLSGIVFYCIKNKEKAYKGAWMLLLPIIGMIVNPLFNHQGVTTLFVINDNPVTMEATLYGLSSGIMIAGTLFWFSSFSSIMTSDKLLYIFGSISPKLALILSMTLRYIPLYQKQIQKTNNAQKAMGLYKDDTIIDKISGALRVFSIMVTWALENGVITADSMTARGYGVGKRSFFALFKWNKNDTLLTVTSFTLFTIQLLGQILPGIKMVWYPEIHMPPLTLLGIITYITFLILCLIPDYLAIKEEIKWKSLMSKI